MKQIMVMLAVIGASSLGRSQDDHALTRDEVGVVKKKLVAIFEAVGEPPPGYTKVDESFSLPTEVSKGATAGRYRPVYGSADRTFGSAAEKKAKKTSEELQTEYQKKLMEAQAKGDYALMGQLAQEMQQKAGQAQMEGMEGPRNPIDVRIELNTNPYQTIDPDAVLFESAGVIALKFPEDVDEARGRVALYCDPVNLKDTKKLSVVNMQEPEGGVAKKTAVASVTIELSGPMTEVVAWAKKISTKKVLAQMD